MNFFELGVATRTEDDAYHFALTHRLLDESAPSCSGCGDVMKMERGKKRHGTDKRWRCFHRICRKSKSFFKNTIFDGIRISISQVLRLIYCWCVELPVSRAEKECNVAHQTAISWYRILRRIAVLCVYMSREEKIGGREKTIEVDETHIFKRKYSVGRVLASESVWVVGGICRETGEVFLKTTIRRGAEHLEHIIRENVKPGTTIVTDCWAGYRNLTKLGFLHQTVNHSKNFVDKEDKRIHTNTIERLWRSLKEGIPKSTRKDSYMDYINEFIFRNIFKDIPKEKRFYPFLTFISTIFNGSCPESD